jgi:acylphosphatase
VERREAIYRGMVQGVGFRYTARAIARNLPVVGYVRNLPDGRVEVVAEGEPADLDQFFERLRVQMADYIADASMAVRPGTGEFDAFEVRF